MGRGRDAWGCAHQGRRQRPSPTSHCARPLAHYCPGPLTHHCLSPLAHDRPRPLPCTRTTAFHLVLTPAPHPRQEEFFIHFAEFEEHVKEPERARAIYKYALDHLPKGAAAGLYGRFVQFEKQHGDRAGIEDVVLSKRRWGGGARGAGEGGGLGQGKGGSGRVRARARGWKRRGCRAGVGGAVLVARAGGRRGMQGRAGDALAPRPCRGAAAARCHHPMLARCPKGAATLCPSHACPP